MTAPDIDDFSTYGGAKQNYAPVEDPTTDRDAADINKALCTVAALTQTATRCWARMVCAATTAGLALATSNSNDGLWPNIFANKPTLVRNGTGDFTLTWPATVLDENGDTHSLNFRAASVSLESGFGFTNAYVSAPNAVRVRLADTTGAASDFVDVTILVKVES